MEGSNINENKIHRKISENSRGDRMEGKVHKMARDCVTEGKL